MPLPAAKYVLFKIRNCWIPGRVIGENDTVVVVNPDTPGLRHLILDLAGFSTVDKKNILEYKRASLAQFCSRRRLSVEDGDWVRVKLGTYKGLTGEVIGEPSICRVAVKLANTSRIVTIPYPSGIAIKTVSELLEPVPPNLPQPMPMP